MKWLVLAFFAVAFVSSLLWIDSSERRFTPSQQTIVAAVAMTGWAIVLFLGYLAA
jgi:hypothetical protein